ncbi:MULTISPECIES: MFS transporter [unclassified Sphingomonas]|uniref:MFS transporter n=1 Tax=unclassified Sphingomonas TaxID=196159 RepID=UPI00226A681A|nr:MULTISPECIES: MFS transporter [unclassified Sphingomonas]
MSAPTGSNPPCDGLPPSAGSPAEPQAAWSAVFSLSLSVFGLATAEFLPASLLTPIANDLAVSIGAAGQAVTITAVIAAIAGPALVLGAARYDRRSIVWAVSILIVVSDLIAAFAPDLTVFLVGRVALGIALAGIGSLAAALCMRLVPPAFFSRAMAMIFTGMTVATIFAPPFGVYIGRILGWRAVFVIAAAIGVLAVVAQLFTLPRMAPTSSGDRDMFSRLMRRPGVLPALGAGMLIIAGHSAGFTYIRPFLETVPQLGADAISLMFLTFGVGGFAGNLLAGLLAERSARLSTGLAALIIVGATAVLLAIGASHTVVFVVVALWGLGFGITPISVQTLTVQAAPDLAEGVGALTMSAFQLAIAIGAVTGGALVGPLGPRGAIGSCTAAAAMGGLLLLGVSRRNAGRKVGTG